MKLQYYFILALVSLVFGCSSDKKKNTDQEQDNYKESVEKSTEEFDSELSQNPADDGVKQTGSEFTLNIEGVGEFKKVMVMEAPTGSSYAKYFTHLVKLAGDEDYTISSSINIFNENNLDINLISKVGGLSPDDVEKVNEIKINKDEINLNTFSDFKTTVIFTENTTSEGGRNQYVLFDGIEKVSALKNAGQLYGKEIYDHNFTAEGKAINLQTGSIHRLKLEAKYIFK